VKILEAKEYKHPGLDDRNTGVLGEIHHYDEIKMSS